MTLRGRCGLALWLAGCSAAIAADGPFRALEFDAALAAARKENKVVLIDFYTTWCRPCRLLDETTWKDARVVKLLSDKAIPLKVDAERVANLASKFSVSAYPTLVILRPDGTELDRFTGYLPPDDFIAAVGPSLSGKDSLTRAREAIDAHDRNNPLARLQFARLLVQRSKFDDALREYLWCFDHGAEYGDADFPQVRLWVVLSDLARLAQYHKPAHDALRQRRAAAQAQLLQAGRPASSQPAASAPAPPCVADFVFLNVALGEPQRTLAAFDQLRAQAGAPGHVIETLRSYALDQLLDARRYDDCVPDPPRVIDSVTTGIADFRAAEIRYRRESAGQSRPAAPAPDRGRFVAGQARYFQALIGARHDAAARQVADRLIAFEMGGSTFMTLMTAALRADRRDEAQRLYGEAQRRLPPAARTAVDAAARRFLSAPPRDANSR
ncbi:MAG: thioredoxin family protein [Phycisphaerae bacterium]